MEVLSFFTDVYRLTGGLVVRRRRRKRGCCDGKGEEGGAMRMSSEGRAAQRSGDRSEFWVLAVEKAQRQEIPKIWQKNGEMHDLNR